MDAIRDHAFVIYLLISLISLYTCLLLSYTWYKKKGASPVYIYVCLMVWGVFFNAAPLTVARYFSTCNILFRDYIISSWMWPVRAYPLLISLAAIALHMTYRIITGKAGEYPFGIKAFKK